MDGKWIKKIFIISLFILGTAVIQVEASFITVDDDEGGNYSSIQEAVDNAENGDTILVNPGIYRENIDVYKELNIVSSSAIAGDEGNRTFVVGEVPEYDVFYVTTNNVTIDGFHISGGPSDMEWYESGIYLDGVDNCSLKNNTLLLNDVGIVINDSARSKLEGNLVVLGYHGVILLDSEENMLSDNWVLDNGWGVFLEDAVNNSLVNNTVGSNEYGITLLLSSDNMINSNTVCKNDYGILCKLADTNVFTNNTVYMNGAGMCLSESGDNAIYMNSFFNFLNAMDDGINVWNNSVAGNFWNDYTGEDADRDGIGDSPYIINETTGSMDYKPLVPLFSPENSSERLVRSYDAKVAPLKNLSEKISLRTR